MLAWLNININKFSFSTRPRVWRWQNGANHHSGARALTNHNKNKAHQCSGEEARQGNLRRRSGRPDGTVHVQTTCPLHCYTDLHLPPTKHSHRISWSWISCDYSLYCISLASHWRDCNVRLNRIFRSLWSHSDLEFLLNVSIVDTAVQLYYKTIISLGYIFNSVIRYLIWWLLLIPNAAYQLFDQ